MCSLQVIGEGGFGAVKVGKCKHSCIRRAVKSIPKRVVNDLNVLHEEIEIHRLLDHPNVVRLLESFEDARNVYLVMEICEGGELFDRIVSSGKFTEALAAHAVNQMLLAINYMHQNHIMHRDLKPENWLLSTKEDVGKTPLKLIDFGLSKRFEPGKPVKTKAGTPNYLAPEVMIGKGYNEKVDIWSIGVIAYMMLSGTQPFTGRTTQAILKSVEHAKVDLEQSSWRRVSFEAKDLVKALLTKVPAARPFAWQSLQHPWLQMAANRDSANVDASALELGQLRAFGGMNKMKKAALSVVATQLTDARLEGLKQLFLSMDKNADGTLSIPELKEGLHKSGVALPKDLDQMLLDADTDGSGVVDYTEFLAATMDKKLYYQEDVVWAAFRKFDLDGSGTISREELNKVLGNQEVLDALHVSETPMDEIFSQVDQNGDGQIDFEEFLAMMRQNEDGKRAKKRASSKPATINSDGAEIGLGLWASTGAKANSSQSAAAGPTAESGDSLPPGKTVSLYSMSSSAPAGVR
jgi:calcium-dependent protein kinase